MTIGIVHHRRDAEAFDGQRPVGDGGGAAQRCRHEKCLTHATALLQCCRSVQLSQTGFAPVGQLVVAIVLLLSSGSEMTAWGVGVRSWAAELQVVRSADPWAYS